jgi:hypothetical protein
MRRHAGKLLAAAAALAATAAAVAVASIGDGGDDRDGVGTAPPARPLSEAACSPVTYAGAGRPRR